MPVITIRLGKGRPIETKRALAKAFTKAAADILDVREEWVTGLWQDRDRGGRIAQRQLCDDKDL